MLCTYVSNKNALKNVQKSSAKFNDKAVHSKILTHDKNKRLPPHRDVRNIKLFLWYHVQNGLHSFVTKK